MLLKVGLILVAVSAYAAGFRRVCYFTNWSQYRKGVDDSMKFHPADIDASLCSHINYAYATMEGNRLKALEWNDDSAPGRKGSYEQVTDLKYSHAGLKVLLAVGGWSFDKKVMSKMLSTAANRKEFVDTSITFLRERNFDGLSLDFMYPGQGPDSSLEDKERFQLLCESLQAAFKAEAERTGKSRLLLTILAAAISSVIELAYDIKEISKTMDHVNLLSFDLNGPWNPWIAHPSPLFPREEETGGDRELNVEWIANYWTAKGCPKEKLNIGLAFHGKSMIQQTPDHDPGAEAGGPAPAGDYTQQKGTLAYYEICPLVNIKLFTRVFHKEHQAPYAYGWFKERRTWVGYDDRESIGVKVRWVKDKGYGGFMTMSLDYDDFNGSKCGKGKYPLMNALNDFLGEKTTVAPTDGPTTPSPKPPTTTTGVPGKTCEDVCKGKEDGNYPHPVHKNKYCTCSPQGASENTCPGGLIWDDVCKICNWSDKVGSCYGKSIH